MSAGARANMEAIRTAGIGDMRALGPAEPSSILLVEDDDAYAYLVRRLLATSAASGWELNVVTRLAAAREWLLTNTVECVLLDLSLPDAVGLETVEGVHSAAPEVPIIVLSGLDDSRMAAASLQYGVQDYLNKAEVDGRSLWRAIRCAAERKRSELILRHQAQHDALTGLPNRTLFVDRLKLAIERLGRTTTQVAVLLIDLDRFKWINDSLGHGFGDELIVEVSRRVSAVLRQGDLAARLGGDELLVMVDNVTSPLDAVAVAKRIHDALATPIQVGERELHVTASIGVAIGDDPSTDPTRLIREADVALYRAKALGKARTELFDAELSDLARARLQLESDLHRAVERGEFVVYYQPVIDLTDGRVAGAEALVRWLHPSGKLVGPQEFIGVAEETGLIVEIGESVLRAACSQMKDWDTAGHPVPSMSVNLSPRQLLEPALPKRLEAILHETGIEPGRLCLEVTESAILADETATWECLGQLGETGIHLAVDDFGTGYSSLGHLRRHSFDILKIDRSFTAGLGTDADSTAIVEAVISLGKVMDMEVIAEGVETPEQADHLRRVGCGLAQGFLFARPSPASAIAV